MRSELDHQRISISTLHQDLEERLAALQEDASVLDESRAVVEAAVDGGEVHYGINTGFGSLADRRIPNEKVEDLQHNLVLSHAVGVDEPIPKEISRLILQLKVHALGLGYSGVSQETFRRLLWMADQDIIPVMPSRGSVGASGDLAPLAHLALPLLGEGQVWTPDGGDKRPAGEILATHNLDPVTLRAKDGLSLINGTQQMSGYGAYVLHRAHQLVIQADIVASMSVEALHGRTAPFDARLHDVRPHPGAQTVATNVRRLLEGSKIDVADRRSETVQDPYSIRCIPQVHGASRDALRHTTTILEREINSVTDNPIVFENGDVLSGGNFHGQPVALALDHAAVALAELADISERRTYLLLDGHEGLPEALMKDTGLNTGYVIPQYTAAALVSENKSLCHPASVDSIPTSQGQEDHVSMGSIGALQLLDVFENVERVLAIELLTAAQALDFRDGQPGRGVAVAHDHVRKRVDHRTTDDLFQEDLERGLSLLQDDLLEPVRDAVEPLH